MLETGFIEEQKILIMTFIACIKLLFTYESKRMTEFEQ